jgi:hypothetical protein
MFQTKVVEKTKTHILCSIALFRKSCRLWDNVKKYGRARQATDDNIIRRMRFACWITKATDTICNTYCFSTAIIVTRTHLNVTFIRILPVFFRLSEVSIHALATLKSDIQSVPRALSPQVKLLGHKADHWPPSGVKVCNSSTHKMHAWRDA